jgi:small-conductance mechanosensitive channel
LATVRLGKLYLWRVFDISHEDNLANRMRQTQLQFVEKFLVFVLVILAAGSILLSFEAARQFGTSLLASAGVASLIIGIGSRQLVENILAGMQIAFAQPIRLDDAVVIEGEWGWIEEITLTYVVVRIWDLRRLIVPLSRLLQQPFQNWTRTSAKIIGSVHLQVSYKVAVDDMRDQLDRILQRTTLWDGDTKVVQVVESHVHTMEIRILISAKSSPRAWDLRCFVREEMLKYLAQQDQSQVGQVRIGMITQPELTPAPMPPLGVSPIGL